MEIKKNIQQAVQDLNDLAEGVKNEGVTSQSLMAKQFAKADYFLAQYYIDRAGKLMDWKTRKVEESGFAIRAAANAGLRAAAWSDYSAENISAENLKTALDVSNKMIKTGQADKKEVEKVLSNAKSALEKLGDHIL